MMSGSHREFSSPFNDFWCCIGTGMESDAKHGDSIYWRSGSELAVNLYIPSTLEWREQHTRLEMTTDYPLSEAVQIRVLARRRPAPLALKLRIPGWCAKPAVTSSNCNCPQR